MNFQQKKSSLFLRANHSKRDLQTVMRISSSISSIAYSYPRNSLLNDFYEKSLQKSTNCALRVSCLLILFVFFYKCQIGEYVEKSTKIWLTNIYFSNSIMLYSEFGVKTCLVQMIAKRSMSIKWTVVTLSIFQSKCVIRSKRKRPFLEVKMNI